MASVKEFEDAVRRPGKFEGEPRYVPYFYEAGLDGMADDDDGRVWTFRVSEEDKKLFPELRRRRTVKIAERSDGFVIEVK